MQPSNIIAVLAMAMTAAQAAPHPAVLETRTDPNCSSTGSDKKVCCVGIACIVVALLPQICNSGSYCCETNSNVGALVNIELLNCVNL